MRKKYVALAVIVFLIGISALGGCNFRSDSVAVVNEKCCKRRHSWYCK